jgi:Tht1-like nuclear fusion protein
MLSRLRVEAALDDRHSINQSINRLRCENLVRSHLDFKGAHEQIDLNMHLTRPLLLHFFFTISFLAAEPLSNLLQINSLPPSPHPSLTALLTSLSLLRPALPNTCYLQNTHLILSHCKPSFPDSLRLPYAINLSVCELDLINQTPSVCRSEDWDACVRELAGKDHWWTTFSGNLRFVGSLCYLGRGEVEKGM